MEVHIGIWNNRYIVSTFLFKNKVCNNNIILCSLKYFVERLSNHTGYSTSKLVGKKLWRVYDTLTCQVNTPAVSVVTVTVAQQLLSSDRK